jgi:hypothetical protein
MNPEENNDPIWNLLEQAGQREASPAFVRNVVREVRKLDADAREAAGGAPRFLSFFFGSRARLGWSSTAFAALVAGAFALHSAWQEMPGSNPPAMVENREIPTAPAYASLALDLIPVSVNPSEHSPSIEAFEAELTDLDYLGELLAVQDTVLLSDEEIARMLY